MAKPRRDRFFDDAAGWNLHDKNGKIFEPSPKNAPKIPNESTKSKKKGSDGRRKERAAGRFGRRG